MNNKLDMSKSFENYLGGRLCNEISIALGADIEYKNAVKAVELHRKGIQDLIPVELSEEFKKKLNAFDDAIGYSEAIFEDLIYRQGIKDGANIIKSLGFIGEVNLHDK